MYNSTQYHTRLLKSVRGDFRLEPSLKTAWLQALRSGQYKQGVGTLHNVKDASYCSLGVCASVAKVPMYEKEGFMRVVETDESNALPYAVLPVEIQARLIGANDGGGLSFAEIADAIEEAL